MGRYKKVVGVYIIHCKSSNKYYIGSSRSIKKRIAYHKDRLRRNIHSNQHLQSAFNLYKESAFTFSILEECNLSSTKQELEVVETKWVLFYNSHKKEFGYNKIMPGSYPLIGEDENKTDTKRTHGIVNPVISIHILTGETREHQNAGIAKTELGLSSSKKIIHVYLYWEGRSKEKRRSYNGYIFIRKSSYIEDFDYKGYKKERVYKPRIKKERTKRIWKKNPEDIIPYEQRNLQRTPIISINIETKEETEFPSISNAHDTQGFMTAKIYKCLKAPFGKYKHRGCYFKYKNPPGAIRKKSP